MIEQANITAIDGIYCSKGTSDSLCVFKPVEEYVVWANIKSGGDGMADVLICTDTKSDRMLIVKFPTDPKTYFTAIAEAELLAKLDHPNIPKLDKFILAFRRPEVGAFGKLLHEKLTSPMPVVVMEYVAQHGGILLSDKQKTKDSLSPEKLLPYLKQIASAIDYAASKGVYHRDIKPSNILIDEDSQKAFLIDFNFGKHDSNLFSNLIGKSDDTYIAGTPGYVSPEQIYSEKKINEQRSQLYGFAVTIFFTMTGEYPTRVDVDDVNSTYLETVLGPVNFKFIDKLTNLSPEVRLRLKLFFERALAKNPEERYGSATELYSALEIALH